MRIIILNECGYDESMLGLSLSYNKQIDKMPDVACKLAGRDSGHNKFLESIVIWLDIIAPRYWWAQFDTYRVGVTKQSESTMHTLTARPLTQCDFELPIAQLERLNSLISVGLFDQLKNELPEGFLQRRIVCTNYKTLRHIIAQRKAHKLKEWIIFCNYLLSMAEHKEFLA